MAGPYTPVAITGFNANPPSDDGSEVSSNAVEWDKHLSKLATPLKDAVEGIDTNVSAAFDGIYGQTDAETTALVTPTNSSLLPFIGGRYGLSPSASAVDNAANLLDLVEVAITAKRNSIDIAQGFHSINAVDLFDITGYTGRIDIRGAGKPNKADSNYDWGTVLDFQNASGDCLTLGNGTTSTRNVILRDIGLLGNTSGAIVQLNYAPQLSGIYNAFIANEGSGNGIDILDVWASTFRDVWVYSTSATGSAITCDTTIGSGNLLMDNVNCEGYDIGFDWGAAYDAGRANTAFMLTHVLRGCQGRVNRINYRMRAGVGLMTLDECFSELASGATGRGVAISDMAGWHDASYSNMGMIKILGGEYVNTDTTSGFVHFEIGSDSATETTDGVGNVLMIGPEFGQVGTNTIGLRIHNSTNAGYRDLKNLIFHNNGGILCAIDDEAQYGPIFVSNWEGDGLNSNNWIENTSGVDKSWWIARGEGITPTLAGTGTFDYSNAKYMPSITVAQAGGDITITLPSSPAEQHTAVIQIATANANQVILDPGSNNLNGSTSDLSFDGKHSALILSWMITTGWTVSSAGQPNVATYTTGAHSTLRDFTGTTTAAQALQILETLVDDLKTSGHIL